VLFQPVLMGKPREATGDNEPKRDRDSELRRDNELENDKGAEIPAPVTAPIRNVTARRRRKAQ
jgi:hypothetical protein